MESGPALLRSVCPWENEMEGPPFVRSRKDGWDLESPKVEEGSVGACWVDSMAISPWVLLRYSCSFSPAELSW